ncbi:MAG: glycosyltransferase [Methylotenera sp.]
MASTALQDKVKRLHLLYFTAEQWPTFRPDVIALFGKYLPRHGITCDLVTELDVASVDETVPSWGAGQAILCKVPKSRAGQYLAKFWHNLRTLIAMDASKYDAIQVRDMTVIALFGLLVARIKGVRFFYWLSYPQSEGQIDRAKSRGIKGGMRFWFPLIQGILGKWLLYRVLLPKSDHIFVQSRQMQTDIARYGIPMSKMTPVPMGVDIELAKPDEIKPVEDSRLIGKRVVAYLGTLDRVRQIEVLFHMLAIARVQIPNILLVLVGDTEDTTHRDWLKHQAEMAGVAENVLWTGWLAASQAWRYIRAAEIGISPIPRGYLLDMSSPTKAVEYMALELPVVVNDNPDQVQVIAESGGGLCVPFQANAFADAVLQLLADPALMRKMGVKGCEYVARVRGYDSIATSVANAYFSGHDK